MKIGFIGLGKMGFFMVKRIMKEHEVVVYARNKKSLEKASKLGAIVAKSILEFIKKLPSTKVIWLMVPSDSVDDVIGNIRPYLKKRDILIDGGNSRYIDSIRRGGELKNIFLDVGTSGGIFGYKDGYCLMVGGDKGAFDYITPILKTLSEDDSYLYVGKSGAGHFTKMIHNGMEYAIMQAYAEGFNLLQGKKEFGLDIYKIAKLFNKNSIIRSFLLKLLEGILKENKDLKNIRGYVEDSGEGRWTVEESILQKISAPTIAISLMERFSSREEDAFSNKILASLRNAFGGHKIKK